MRGKLLSLVTLLLASSAAVRSQQPGIAATVSSGGSNYVLNQFIPVIEAKIGDIPIPDLPFDQDGFTGSVSSIKCSSFTIATADLAFSPPDSIDLSLTDITVTCNANWDFKLKSWPHIPDGSGTVDISVSQTSASLTVGMTTVNEHPQLTSEAVSLTVGNIDMSFHGSLLDWILDLFKGLIENAVKSNLQSVFGTTMANFITGDVNGVLANLDLDIPINAPAPYNIAEARFGLLAPPVVNTTYFGMALQGDIVPISNPVSPPITPPSLPPFSPSDGSVFISAALAPYTILSAMYTFLTANALTWTVTPSNIPLGFNSTQAYTLVAPGLPTAYPNAAVELGVSITALPTLTMSSSNGIATVIPMDFSFNPQAANGTFVEGFTLSANASLSMTLDIAAGANSTFVIAGALAYLDATLALASSSVGAVNVNLLQALVNITFDGIIVPLFNDLLSHGIPLPQAPGMVFTTPTLATGNGYVLFSSNFTFDPSEIPQFNQYLESSRIGAVSSSSSSSSSSAALPETQQSTISQSILMHVAKKALRAAVRYAN